MGWTLLCGVEEPDKVGHCAFGGKGIDVVFEAVSFLCSLTEVIEWGLRAGDFEPPQAWWRFAVSVHDWLAVSGDFDGVLGKENFTAIVAQDWDGYNILFDCVKFVTCFGRGRESAFDDVTFGVWGDGGSVGLGRAKACRVVAVIVCGSRWF
jgi:hypothetical protein